jgi:hypothetical protein
MTTMNTRLAHCCSLVALLCLASPSFAEPIDPAAARDLLKQGYALKQEGKHAEALARLLESLRLDSQIKTLMNIADCEEMLGQLSQAQKHWVLARDQAVLQGDQLMLAEAERRLVELEARMPRLTIRLVGRKVQGTEVRRSNVLLGPAALGVPLPADPASHVVLVTAPGHQDARYDVVLAERDNKSIEVKIGVALAGSPAPRAGATPAPSAGSEPPLTGDQGASEVDRASGFWTGQRIAAVGTAGLGAAGLALAGWSWSRASGEHDDALALCNPECGDDAREKQDEAESSARLSSVMLVASSVLVAGGAVLWLTAPSPESSTKVGFTPGVSDEAVGLFASGAF